MILMASMTLAAFLVVAYFLLSLVTDVGEWVATRAARVWTRPSQVKASANTGKGTNAH